MTAIARLHEQRSAGHVRIRMESHGIAVMREAGSLKCRMPRGSQEAILINTSGGLAGGDSVSIEAEVGPSATLTLTSQTAERVYRSLGPAACVDVNLRASPGSALLWMPQETILFEQGALSRTLNIELAADARFLAVEPLIFGRTEMGEHANRLSIRDRWSIRKNGHLIHAEALTIGPDRPSTPATLGAFRATATIILISEDADRVLATVRPLLTPNDGASAWNGKFVARLMANDGFDLRKTLIKVLSACAGRDQLPKCWTF